MFKQWFEKNREWIISVVFISIMILGMVYGTYDSPYSY
jgi:hypothetical protein